MPLYPMSYTAAAAVAPASNSPAGYSNYRALFDHIFSQHNNLDAILAGAVSTGSAGKIAKFDGAGGMAFASGITATDGVFSGTMAAGTGSITTLNAGNYAGSGISSAALASKAVSRDASGGTNFGANVGITNATISGVAPDVSHYPLYLRTYAGGLYAILVQNSIPNANLFILDISGNGFFLGQITAGSGAVQLTDAGGHINVAALNTVTTVKGGTGLTASGALGNILSSDGSTWQSVAGLLFPLIVSDYRLIPSVTPGHASISAGSQYGDSLGGAVGPLTLQDVNLGAQPTGTDIQYQFISMAPTTGAPVVTNSTAGPTGLPLPSPNYPVGNVYVGRIRRRGATSNPGDVIAASDITQAIVGIGGGGGGGGGGTTDSTVRAALAWSNGASGIGNWLNSQDANANGFFNWALSRPSVTDAAISDIFASMISGNFVGSLHTGSPATTLVIYPNQTGTTIAIAQPTVIRKVTPTVSSPLAVSGAAVSGTPALFHVIAKLDAAGVNSWTARISTDPITFSGNEIIIADIVWTGSAWDFTTIHYPLFPVINSGHFSNIRITEQNYFTASTDQPGTGGAVAALAGTSPVSLNFPIAGMKGDITIEGDWTQSTGTASGGFYVVLLVDGVWDGVRSLQNLYVATAGAGPFPFVFHKEVGPLTSGIHTFQPGYIHTAGLGTFPVKMFNCKMWSGAFTV